MVVVLGFSWFRFRWKGRSSGGGEICGVLRHDLVSDDLDSRRLKGRSLDSVKIGYCVLVVVYDPIWAKGLEEIPNDLNRFQQRSSKDCKIYTGDFNWWSIKGYDRTNRYGLGSVGSWLLLLQQRNMIESIVFWCGVFGLRSQYTEQRLLGREADLFISEFYLGGSGISDGLIQMLDEKIEERREDKIYGTQFFRLWWRRRAVCLWQCLLHLEFGIENHYDYGFENEKEQGVIIRRGRSCVIEGYEHIFISFGTMERGVISIECLYPIWY